MQVPPVRGRERCVPTGQGKGESFTWDIVGDVTVRGASSLTETNTMPETSFTITQGTLTITEAGNAIPYSENWKP